MFSNLFFITLPNIKKYFPGIYFSQNLFSKKNYFPADKRDLKNNDQCERGPGGSTLLSHGHFLGHDNFYRNMYVVMEVRV
jgi:hypothetical protein